MYAYLVLTVNKTFGYRTQSTVTGNSAKEVADKVWAQQVHELVEVAPASPVNGYDGTLPYLRGDTASRNS